MKDPTNWIKKKSHNADPRKHARQRAKRGFSDYDWWNFNDYLSFVIIGGLEKFKTGSGYPANLSGPDEWVEILDKMIDGFKAHQVWTSLDTWDMKQPLAEWEEPYKAKWKEGSDLFIEYYGSLWD